jgi:lipopolysaccharide exporter
VVTDPGDLTIATRTARAAVWSLLAITSTRIISLVSLIILARLLAPRDFGLLTFALVYITYIETVGDLGTGLALIYWPDRKDEAALVTFWINLVAGLFWFAVTLVLAPSIAKFFQSPEATSIVKALAWSFPLKYLGNTHDALAQKELRFRARLIPELGMAAGKATLALSLANAGFGAWSLVFGHLGGLTCWTGLQWLVTSWRPRLQFPRDLLAPMLLYGRGMIAVNVIAAVVHHADFAVVGRMLGATALGVYQMAARVPEMSVTILIWVAGKVLFPAFAAVHAAGENLRYAYLAALRYMSLLTVPAAVGLAVTAEPLVLTFFGEKWSASIPVLRALAIYAGVRALGTPAGDLMKATGRAGLLARLGILKAAILVPAVIAAATWNVATVSLALVAVSVITLMLNLGVAAVPLRVTVAEMVKAVQVSLAGGAVLALVAVALGWMLDLRAPVELLIMVAAGAAAYTVTIALLDPEALDAARRRIFSRKRESLSLARLGRFFIPVKAPRARRYFFDNLYVMHRRRDRLIRLFAPAFLPWRRGTKILPETVAPEALALLEGMTEGEDLQPIVAGDYAGQNRSRLLLFLFRPDGSDPFAVAKLRPLAAPGASLEHEWEALKFLETLPREIRDTAPRALAYRRSQAFEALLLSHLPGRSAYLEIHGPRPGRHVLRHFEAAAAWLARLHVLTQSGSHCAIHGDFWARNLLTSGGRTATGVVDWEHFSRSGSPFEDLFHFPLSYGLNYPWRATPVEAFRNTFLESTVVSAATRRYLEHYCNATGLKLSTCREWFETYLLAKGGEDTPPWGECLRILQSASRSVFSG